VLGLVLLSHGIAAYSDEEIKEANETYHDQRIQVLGTMSSHKKDDFTLVYLNIASEMGDSNAPAGVNTTLWRNLYFPKVDQFTELRSNFTQSLVELPNISVRVWLQFPAFKVRSESRIMLKRYSDSDSVYDLLVGCRAITVVMDKGVVTDMYWDDSCSGCSAEYCLEDSCSSKIEDLRPMCHDKDALAEDPFHCGLKIYIAWIGTDSDGKSLNSYTSVPSRFEKYSFISSAYDAASGFTSDFISFWKKPLN